MAIRVLADLSATVVNATLMDSPLESPLDERQADAIDGYYDFSPSPGGNGPHPLNRGVLAPTDEIITDPHHLGKVVQERRLALRLSQLDLQRRYGISAATLHDIESGTYTQYTRTVVAKICLLLKIRFNYLPYVGAPLREPAAIWADIDRRAFNIGLTAGEFASYLGMDIPTLHALVFSGQPLARKVCDVLGARLHLRVWPEPLGKIAADIAEIAAYSRGLRATWGMTVEEMAAMFHLETTALWAIEGERTQLYSCKPGLSQVFARALGFHLKGPDTLEDTRDKQWYDKDLVTLIKARLAVLEYTPKRLAKEAKVYETTLRRILAGERIDPDVPVTHGANGEFEKKGPYREAIQRVCAVLKIPLMSVEKLQPLVLEVPSENQTAPLARAWLARQVAVRVRELRGRLFLSDREAADLAGVINKTFRRLEAGDFNFPYEAAIGKIMRRFGMSLTWDETQTEPPFDPRVVPFAPPPAVCVETSAWWERVYKRMAFLGLSSEKVAQQCGLSGYPAHCFRNKTLPWHHPSLVRIAEHLGLFTPEILQAILERDKVCGNLDAVAARLRLDPTVFAQGNFFQRYPERQILLAGVIVKRMALLKSFRESHEELNEEQLAQAHSFESVAAMRDFLRTTGGDLLSITTLSPAQVFYLLSLGDTYSAAVYLHDGKVSRGSTVAGSTRRQELIASLTTAYNAWLVKTFGYGVRFDDVPNRWIQSIRLDQDFRPVSASESEQGTTSKSFEILLDRTGLDRDFKSLQDHEYARMLKRTTAAKGLGQGSKGTGTKKGGTPNKGNDDFDLAPPTGHPRHMVSGDGLGIAAVTGTVESPLDLSVAPADSPPPPILKGPGFASPGPGSVRLFAGLGAPVPVDEFLPAGVDEPASAGVDTAAYPEDTAPWEDSAATYVDAEHDASALAGAGLLMPCVKGVM